MGRKATNIIITGFSATGKSQVAREVSRRLNWNFIDTDDEIVKRMGKPIAEIFQQDGEGKFREFERYVIKETCRQKQVVIAVGGGAIVDPQNCELLARNGFVVCLEAKPETIYQRLFREAAYGQETEVRPLLSSNSPLERIKQLKAARQPYYANVDWTVHTDSLSIAQAADEVVRAWRLFHRVPLAASPLGSKLQLRALPNPRADIKKAAHSDIDKDVACMVETPTQSYPVFVGYNLLRKLGEKIRGADLSGMSIVISDETVFSLYGSRVERVLRDSGFPVYSFAVPPGEATKDIDYAMKIYDFLVEHRVERGDILIALGGGMVGDLAGFVAATFLRGMSWIQVPTSLVAMVDASIGGKVGVNHLQGKNLIGAFYQPNFVLADVQTLSSLPQRELTSGWAEVIKYGLILDRDFFEFLKTDVDRLIKLEPSVVTQAIARSASIKAQVVSEDEKERGKRTILNYGHTIAHGLEAVTQYRRFLHGEAVSIGMMAAAKLGQRLGLLSSDVIEQQQSLLQRFGLPTSFHNVDLTDVMKAIELDKKTRGGVIRWVLLEDIGKATIYSDVPQQDVMAVLQELTEM